jgi:hypothetical protein
MNNEAITSEPKPRDRRALNAYRHGLTGQVLINTPEDQAAYLKHCQGIQESLAPEGAFEAGLVQSVADDRWRLARAAAMENSILASGLGDGRPPKYTDPHEQIDVAFAQAVVWLKEGKSLGLLTLYEGRIQRRVEKNLALIRQLQQDRKAALQQAVEEAELLAQFAASKGETYDIERDFPREALPHQFVFSTTQIARLVAHRRRLSAAKKQFQAAPKVLSQAA